MENVENPRFGEIARFWDVLYGGGRLCAPFDIFHHSEEAFEESGRSDAEFIRARLEKYVPARAKILDFGCGTGRVTLPLSSLMPGMRFRGTDISQKALQIGRQRSKSANNISFHNFDGRTAASIEDKSVDCIVSWRVIERIPRHMVNVVMREWNRVITDGGILLFDVPVLPETKQRTKIIDEPLDDDLISPRRYDVNTIKIFVEKAGFVIEDQEIYERTALTTVSGGGAASEYRTPFRLVRARKRQSLPAESYPYAREAVCNICGNARFSAGPIGRTARTRVWPRCSECRALCRMRILRKILDRFPPALLRNRKALQFSPELSYRREWFKSFELSVYDGDASNAEGLNSMDLQALPLRAGSYDWVVCNHVLEHVENDGLAMKELARICSKNGVLQLAVPGPLVTSKTRDFGRARPEEHFHFRSYGRDFPDLFLGHAPGYQGISILDRDHISNVQEIFYFFSRSDASLKDIAATQGDLSEVSWHGN